MEVTIQKPRKRRRVRYNMKRKYVIRRRIVFGLSLILLTLTIHKLASVGVSAVEKMVGNKIYEEVVFESEPTYESNYDVIYDRSLYILDNRNEFSEGVENYRGAIKKELLNRGMDPRYENVLLAILSVECGGNPDVLSDPFQSSESRGLNPGEIDDPNESMKAAIDLFESLCAKARRLDLDLFAVIQGYNYGPGYLDYIHDVGERYSLDTAKDFARLMSNDTKVDYNNSLSSYFGNTWRYKYGNYYYVALVLDQMGYSYDKIDDMINQY